MSAFLPFQICFDNIRLVVVVKFLRSLFLLHGVPVEKTCVFNYAKFFFLFFLCFVFVWLVFQDQSNLVQCCYKIPLVLFPFTLNSCLIQKTMVYTPIVEETQLVLSSVYLCLYVQILSLPPSHSVNISTEEFEKSLVKSVIG